MTIPTNTDSWTDEHYDAVIAKLNRIDERGSKHLRRYTRSALVAFVGLVLALGYSFYASGNDANNQRAQIVHSGSAIAVDGCNRDFKTIAGLRSILIASRDFQTNALKRGDISHEGYDRALAFYDKQLHAIPLPDCRAAEKVLTSDPDESVRVPVPRHP